MTIEAKIVKNFLVVVIIEQTRGPKLTIVRNIKSCPTALVMQNMKMLGTISG